MNSDFVSELINLGMTKREAEIYSALMGKPEWKSGEIQQVTGISRVQTHQLLEQMVAHNYCSRRSEGRFSFYRATPPNVLLDILNERWEMELASRQDRASSLLTKMNEIYEDVKADDKTLDFIEIIQTPRRVHQRFISMLLNSHEELLAINRSPYSFATGKTSKKLQDQQTEANSVVEERGVKVRSLTMYEEDTWPFFEKEFQNMGANEEARIIDFVPIKMGIFDRKHVYMLVNSVPTNLKGSMNEIIIHDKDIASACVDLFESYWEKSILYKTWLEMRKS